MSAPESYHEAGPGSPRNQPPARIDSSSGGAVRPWSEGRPSSSLKNGGRPPQINSAPDPLGMLVAFRRRWLLALTLGFVAMVGAGAAAYYLLPQSKYYAFSTLLISGNPPKIFMGTNENFAPAEQYRATQKFRLTSGPVLKAALANPRVQRLRSITEQLDPKDWLKNQIKFKDMGEVLEVGMYGDDPEEVHILVNAVVEAFSSQILEADKSRRQKELDDLRGYLDEWQKDMKQKKDDIRRMAQSLGSNDPVAIAAANQYKQEHIALLRQEKMKSEQEILKAETRLKVILGQGSDMADELAAAPSSEGPAVPPAVSEAQVRDAIQQDPTVRALLDAERKARDAYDKAYRVARNPSDPSVSGPLAKLRDATSRRKAREDGIREFLVNNPEQALTPANNGNQPQSPAQEVAELRDTVRFHRELLKSFDPALEAAMKDVKSSAVTSIDLTTEQEQVGHIAELVKKLGTEVEGRKLEKNAPDRTQIYTRAEIPKVKENASKHLKMCLAAAGGAFLFGVMSVSFWEFRARRVNSIEEVVTGLGLNLVGALPALPTRKLGRSSSAQALEDRAWQNMLVESVDATRTMLLHMSRMEGLRSVMICSAMKGEGKTSLSVHLATSLARAGQRTLLIDCDLRNPSVNKLYDLAADPGLCEYLRGEAELADVTINVIRQAPAGGLDLIPAGRYDAIALQSLARDGVRNLIEVMGPQYDFVIVDSAPILPVADTLLLSQQVDAVLFSILRDVSRLHHVHAAHERVANLGVRILGAVVNGAPKAATYGVYPYG